MPDAGPLHPDNVPAKDRLTPTPGVSRLAPSLILTLRGEETIYRQDQPVGFLYEVVIGLVRAVRLAADGRRVVQDFFVPGDVFGLEHGERHLCAAEAVGETRVARCERRALDRALGEEAAARPLWSWMTLAAERAQAWLVCAGAVEKVSAFLVEMAERTAADRRLDLAMSRYDIADYLGLSSETVSRTFTALRHRGVIVINGQTIRLLRPDELRRLSSARG